MAHPKLTLLNRSLATSGAAALLLAAPLASAGLALPSATLTTVDENPETAPLTAEELEALLLDGSLPGPVEEALAIAGEILEPIPLPLPHPAPTPAPAPAQPAPPVEAPPAPVHRGVSAAGASITTIDVPQATATDTTVEAAALSVESYTEDGPALSGFLRSGLRSQDGPILQPFLPPVVSPPLTLDLIPEVAKRFSSTGVPAAGLRASATPVGGMVPQQVPPWLFVAAGTLLFGVASANMAQANGRLDRSFVRKV